LYDTIKEKFSEKMITIFMNEWSDNFAFDSTQVNVQFQDATKNLLVDAFKFDYSEIFGVDDIVHIYYGEERRIYNPYISW
jgi:hypothetical protein